MYASYIYQYFNFAENVKHRWGLDISGKCKATPRKSWACETWNMLLLVYSLQIWETHAPVSGYSHALYINYVLSCYFGLWNESCNGRVLDLTHSIVWFAQVRKSHFLWNNHSHKYRNFGSTIKWKEWSFLGEWKWIWCRIGWIFLATSLSEIARLWVYFSCLFCIFNCNYVSLLAEPYSNKDIF